MEFALLSPQLLEGGGGGGGSKKAEENSSRCTPCTHILKAARLLAFFLLSEVVNLCVNPPRDVSRLGRDLRVL